MAELYALPMVRYAGAFLIELDPTVDWSAVPDATVASDGSAWLDYTRLPTSGAGTENRVLSHEISDGADLPVRTLRATLHMNTAEGSISSGAVNSYLNNLSGAYRPALFGGRRIIVQDPLGSSSSTNPADWRPRFWGFIDDHPASHAGHIEIFARDASARLMIPYTGDPVWIGTQGELVPLSEGVQRVLDARFGDGAWPLKVVGGDLEWAIPAFPLEESDDVLQTIRDMAQQRGAVVRWWMDETTGRFQLTLFVLQVDKASPEFTYDPDETEDIPAHGSDIAAYRNDFTFRYVDESGQRVTIHRAATTAEKQAFGLKPLEIGEGSTSHINTFEEAEVMLDSVEAALRVPAVTGTRLLPRNNLIEINSLLRFSGDGRVTQENADLYVVSWTERVAMNGDRYEASTQVQLRGAPVGQIGAYLRSFARGRTSVTDDADYAITDQKISRTASTITLSGTPGPKVVEILAFSALVTVPFAAEDWPDTTASPAAVISAEDFEADGYTSDIPTGNSVRLVVLITVDAAGRQRFEWRYPAYPTVVAAAIKSATVWDQIVEVIGNDGVRSIKLERIDGGGSWVKHIDGSSHAFDLSKQGILVAYAPIGSSETWQVRVTAYAGPVSDPGSAADTWEGTVYGTGSSPAAEWDLATAAAPPVGSEEVTISLRADSAPSGHSVKVFERHRTNFGPWGGFSDITASLDPVPAAPPTSNTEYTYFTGFTRTLSHNNVASFEFRAEILDGSGGVVDASTVLVEWGYA